MKRDEQKTDEGPKNHDQKLNQDQAGPDLEHEAQTNHDPQSQDEQTKKSGVNWKLVDTIAKLFVAGLILFLCWNVLQSMFYVPPSNVDNRRKINSGETIDEANQVLADFTAGSWTFGSSDWNLRIYPETKENGLLVPPKFQQRVANSSFDDRKFIGLVKQMGAQPKQIGDGFQLWQSTGPNGIPLVLFTRDSSVQAMRTRFASSNGVSIVEGRPRSELDENQPRLLPIVEGISQSATRVDAKGKLTSAILNIDSQYPGDLRVVWKEHGWDVKPMKGFRNNDPGVNAERYRCSKDDELVDATFFLNKNSQPEQVILNRINLGSD